MILTWVGQHPNALIAGDFNRDGHMDLAVVHTSDTGTCFLGIWLGDGQGSFRQTVYGSVGICDINNPGDIKTGDFNNDDRLDVIMTASGTNDLLLLFGDGQGEFKAAGTVALGHEPLAISVGDFNNDVNLDLATANLDKVMGLLTVSILLGDGSGGFMETHLIKVGRSYNEAVATIVAGDFNNDGYLDLLVSGQPITLLWGNGDGSFEGESLAWSSQYITAGDFDNGGNLDIAASEGFLLLGDGKGRFEVREWANEFRLAALMTGDFNNDGNLDLAGGISTRGEFVILLGDGQGGFSDWRILDLEGSVS